MAAGQGAAARGVVAAGRAAAQRRGHDHLGAAPAGREGRPQGTGAPGTARGVLRPEPGAGHPDDRVHFPGPGALPRQSGAAAGHPLAPGELPAADGLRPRSDGGQRAGPADRQALLHEHRIRFGAKEFALSTLRDIYGAALGYQVDATNLQRVLARRGVITATGTIAQSGRSGGRPAALYRFTDAALRVTDEFAALRPPGLPG